MRRSRYACHAVGADLDSVRQRVGQMRDVRTRLGVHLAALEAVAPIDTVRAVAEGAIDNADRPDPHRDALFDAPRHNTDAASEIGWGESG